jgi:hypothetical protein
MPNNDNLGYESMRKLSYYTIGGALIGVVICGILAYYFLR